MNLSLYDEAIVRKYFTASESEKLQMFLEGLWESDADFKVLIARRMFNMNSALMNICEVENDEQYLTESIMSNTAFLLSANKIADQYLFRKRFPRIVIYDDIMLHGRGIMKLLYTFEELVYARIGKNNNSPDRVRLRKDLADAVSIHVFAQNAENILVDSQFSVYSQQIINMTGLRDMSQRISGFLQSCGIANTSYVLSAKIPPYLMRTLNAGTTNIASCAFRYRGKYQLLYIRKRSARIQETIRINFPNEGSFQSGILTSLPIFGDIERARFEVLCKNVAEYMESGVRFSQIADCLRQKEFGLIKPRAQLLTMLFSILSLSDFCRQNMYVDRRELYRILVDGDFDKVISNFDRGEIFRYEILRFFKEICTGNEDGAMLWRFLDEAAGSLRGEKETPFNDCFSIVPGPKGLEREDQYAQAEDIFYEIGMDSEYDAYHHIRLKKDFNPRRDGFDQITISQYLRIMSRQGFSNRNSIGCILGLMDSGLMSLNIEMNRNGAPVVRNVLKAGEMATYALPRRFSVFIPALAIIEKRYEKQFANIRDIVGSFIEYLQDHCYSQNGYVLGWDVRQLSELRKKKWLLLYTYSTGHRMQDWDIKLRNWSEYKIPWNMIGATDDEPGQMTYEEEQARKNHYAICAREYIWEKA